VENPDVVVVVLGLTRFLRPNFRINRPLIGIFTSPIYTTRELLSVGLEEFIRHGNYLYLHLLGAFTPGFLITRGLVKFSYIITLSKENKNRLQEKSQKSEILVIPPKIEKLFFEPPDPKNLIKLKKEQNPDNLPIILYFTSPLTLRGTDVLVRAFSRLRKEHPCILIFLSRPDDKQMEKEIRYLQKIINQAQIQNSVIFIHRNLTKDEIKKYLYLADVICLPFKILISDCPVSILEAMATHKPVISTNIMDLPRILENKGFSIQPNNNEDLYSALSNLLNSPNYLIILGNNARKYMESYPKWEKGLDKFNNLLLKIRSQ